jgi:Fe-S-cluster containining protein
MRFRCNKQPGCLNCAECCKFREKPYLTEQEDIMLRKKMYEKTGILYKEPFHRYTISLTTKEKNRLNKLAQEKNIQLNIRSKKYIILKNKLKILDYYIDHDVCPFLKNNECSIYKHRPKMCKDFPLNDGPKTRLNINNSKIRFEEALKLADTV